MGQVYELSRLANGWRGERSWDDWAQREARGLLRLCPQHLITSDGVRVGLFPGFFL